MVASFPQAESPASIHLLAIDDTGRTTIRVLWSYNLLGHSTSAMVRRYSATYDAAKAADAHAAFSPAARLLATEASAAG